MSLDKPILRVFHAHSHIQLLIWSLLIIKNGCFISTKQGSHGFTETEKASKGACIGLHHDLCLYVMAVLLPALETIFLLLGCLAQPSYETLLPCPSVFCFVNFGCWRPAPLLEACSLLKR